jgi:peptidoglycan/xylan/chitin deacetylase (PgdA/CDA1 family)
LRLARGGLIELLGGLVAGLVVTCLRLSPRRRGLVLVYHAVAERQGAVSVELVPAHGLPLFRRQLRHLRRWYRVVDAETIVAATRSRRRGGRFPVAVTFDDDLQSHVRTALPILAAEGVSATFFLCGASLERPFSFWWERLQRAFDEKKELPALVELGAEHGIRHVAERVERLPPDQLDDLARELGDLLGPDPAVAGLRQSSVVELVRAGMSVGFHTRQHYSLPSLPDDELDRALVAGRKELESVVGRKLDLIAYPHGRSDDRVAAAAERAGFAAGFTGTGRAVTTETQPLSIPRVSPAYRSAGHFSLQVLRALAAPPQR